MRVWGRGGRAQLPVLVQTLCSKLNSCSTSELAKSVVVVVVQPVLSKIVSKLRLSTSTPPSECRCCCCRCCWCVVVLMPLCTSRIGIPFTVSQLIAFHPAHPKALQPPLAQSPPPPPPLMLNTPPHTLTTLAIMESAVL